MAREMIVIDASTTKNIASEGPSGGGYMQPSGPQSPSKQIISDYVDFDTIGKDSPVSAGSKKSSTLNQSKKNSSQPYAEKEEDYENYITEDNPLTERFLNEYMTAED